MIVNKRFIINNVFVRVFQDITIAKKILFSSPVNLH